MDGSKKRTFEVAFLGGIRGGTTTGAFLGPEEKARNLNT